jgi:hypothetical protein
MDKEMMTDQPLTLEMLDEFEACMERPAWPSNDDLAPLVAAARAHLEAQECIQEAWNLFYNLEREWCIDNVMYDGRAVAAWCDKAQAFLPQPPQQREAQSIRKIPDAPDTRHCTPAPSSTVEPSKPICPDFYGKEFEALGASIPGSCRD